MPGISNVKLCVNDGGGPTGHPAWWQACSHSRSWEKPAPR